MTFSRVVLAESPFPNPVPHPTRMHNEVSPWPARWVAGPWIDPPFVTLYRLAFDLESEDSVRVHVSADERYELWCDGCRVGRGPERSVPQYWPFETYDLTLGAGSHLLVARVWTLGRPHSPPVQQRVRPGFLLAADDPALRDRLSTGHAPWKVRRMEGCQFLPKGPCFGTSGFEDLSAAAGQPWRCGEGEGWRMAEAGEEPVNACGVYRGGHRHRMAPAQLPAMLDRRFEGGRVRAVQPLEAGDPKGQPVKEGGDCEPWQQWWSKGNAVTIPQRTRVRVLIDLEDYVCGYVELKTRGGAGSLVRWHWEETLYHGPERDRGKKGQRDAVDGLTFDGFGDQFRPAGECHFATLWWRCGRYMELMIETAEEALTLQEGLLFETRYPYHWQGGFESGDTALMEVLPILERGVAMCSHETYMDCPFYEQLMYVGDTRLQALVTMVTSPDVRLVRKALLDGHSSRWPDGMISSNFAPGGQMIATFGLAWVAMLQDYLWWREDAALLKELLPGARAILDWWLSRKGADGLLISPTEWSFVDWVASPTGREEDHPWHTGMPPGGEPGQVSYILNWLVVWTLGILRDLEEAGGHPERAAIWEMEAVRIFARLELVSWDAAQGLYRDEPEGRWFSQHGQIVPILTGRIDPERAQALSERLDRETELVQSTLYFSHYLLEAYYQTGNQEAFDRRLEEWREMPGRGFKTPYEVRWDETRSDCHAWGSHPLFHLHASVLGVRPAAMGFRNVRIGPMLPVPGFARGRVPHPSGEVVVDLERTPEGWRGSVSLPAGVQGEWAPPGEPVREFEGALQL